MNNMNSNSTYTQTLLMQPDTNLPTQYSMQLNLSQPGPGEFGMGLHMNDDNHIIKAERTGSVGKKNGYVNSNYRFSSINGAALAQGVLATSVLRDMRIKGHDTVTVTFEKIQCGGYAC